MNTTTYTEQGNHISNFEVGQEVVFFTHTNGFNERRPMSTGWKVRKISKTRITFTREAPHGTFDKVYVVSKYGEVSKEVGHESYHSDRVVPADHPSVAKAVAHNEAVDIRNKALADMREASKGRYLTVETAEEVIASLQAYIASTK